MRAAGNSAGHREYGTGIRKRQAMKKYKYVNVYMGKFIGAGSEEHRDIINQYAANGYRYVGYIPTKISENGKIKSMDLVFEIDE